MTTCLQLVCGAAGPLLLTTPDPRTLCACARAAVALLSRCSVLWSLVTQLGAKPLAWKEGRPVSFPSFMCGLPAPDLNCLGHRAAAAYASHCIGAVTS
jgi:hypothetical protein